MKLDKNYKVRVTPEQSREIHSLILLEGGEVSYGLKPQLQDEFLVVENEHDSVVIYYTDQDIFPTTENQEIQADDLIALLTDLLKSAENSLQDMKLTPEFEAVEPILVDNRQVNIQDIGTDILDTNADIKDTPKFKVGNKVYKYGETDVKTVLEVFEDGYMRISNYPHRVNHEVLCHATPENHAVLSKPFPAIEFEQPPKPLTGIELAKKLIAKGHNYLVVDTVIGIRVLTRLEGNTLIDSNNVRLDELDDITPLNDETGEPLTESILND